MLFADFCDFRGKFLDSNHETHERKTKYTKERKKLIYVFSCFSQIFVTFVVNFLFLTTKCTKEDEIHERKKKINLYFFVLFADFRDFRGKFLDFNHKPHKKNEIKKAGQRPAFLIENQSL